jgi:HAD superfamily hydrolase (TIGR01450 family)
MKPNGYMFDLEGTLVKGKEFCPLPGSAEALEACRPHMVVTNNTTHGPNDLLSRLSDVGLRLEPKQLLSPLVILPDYVRRCGWKRVLPVGAEALGRCLRDHGFDVADRAPADAVVVGLDTALDYDKMRNAARALLHGAALVALHRNRLFHDRDCAPSPSAGATVSFLMYATGVRPRVVGKPSRTFFRIALDRLGVAAPDCMVVGDDPFAEAAGAKALGMRAVFVLSGKYDSPDVLRKLPPTRRPDLVIRSLEELPGVRDPHR